MARQARIYRVVGRRGEGLIAMRLRVAAATTDDALRVAKNWAASGPISHDVKFNILDVHRTDDYVVVGEASDVS